MPSKSPSTTAAEILASRIKRVAIITRARIHSDALPIAAILDRVTCAIPLVAWYLLNCLLEPCEAAVSFAAAARRKLCASCMMLVWVSWYRELQQVRNRV